VGIAAGPVKVFPDGGDQIATFTLAVTNADGSDQRTVLRLGGYQGDLDYPQFSPDGKRLVFEQNNSQLGRPSRGRAVFVVNVDGTGLHRITPWQLAAGDGPDWSPNGKLLLFRSYVDVASKQSQLYLARPDGTGLKQITHFRPGTSVTSASFSPDGRWITFGRSGVGGKADVFVMRVDGTGIRPLTRTRLWDSARDWGPRSHG
jgi:TolB protein